MSRRYRLEPAASVIAILGGPKIVSGITGIGRTQVWRWTQPKFKGGTDGKIPMDHQGVLLTWAEENHKPLKPENLIRQVKEPIPLGAPVDNADCVLSE